MVKKTSTDDGVLYRAYNSASTPTKHKKQS